MSFWTWRTRISQQGRSKGLPPGPKNTRVNEAGDGERFGSLKLNRQAGTSQENIKVMFEPEKLLCEGLGLSGGVTDI